MRYSYDGFAPWGRPFLFLSSLRPCIVHHHSIMTGGAGGRSIRIFFLLPADSNTRPTWPRTPKTGNLTRHRLTLSGGRKGGGQGTVQHCAPYSYSSRNLRLVLADSTSLQTPSHPFPLIFSYFRAVAVSDLSPSNRHSSAKSCWGRGLWTLTHVLLDHLIKFWL